MNKQNITFQMDFEMFDFIERKAEEMNVSKSEIVRRMVKPFMEDVRV